MSSLAVQKFRSLGWVVALTALGLSACPEDIPGPGVTQRVEVGGICGEDADCASQLCRDGLCVVPNVPPIADAGPNRVTLVGLPIGLDGTGSADSDAVEGSPPLTYMWEVVSTPADAAGVFSAPDGASPSFTGDTPGVYQVRLTVRDEEGGTGMAEAAVFVLNQDGSFLLPEGAPCEAHAQCESGKCEKGTCQVNFAPVADAGVSTTVSLGETVTLDGSGSSDPDGDALTFEWTLGQLPENSIASLTGNDIVTTSFTPDTTGLYTARLFVNDGWLGSAPHVVAVMVVDGASDLRPDGDPCDKDDQCESQFCFEGSCKTNVAPIALAGTGVVVQVGTQVAIDGGESSDPEGLALSYQWAVNEVTPFEPGATSVALVESPNVSATTFTPDIPGVFVLRLVVDDGMLESLPDDLVIYADADPVNLLPDGADCGAGVQCQSGFCFADACATNAAPTAVAGPTQSVQVGSSVLLDGGNSSDPEGFAVTFQWQLVEVPEGSTAALDDPSVAAPSFVADVAGAFVLRLVVSDGDLESAPSTVIVLASVAGGGAPNGAPCVTDVECLSGFCSSSGACATNTPPTAVATGPNVAPVGSIVALDGSGSSDAEGHSLTWSWVLTQAPEGSIATLDDVAAVAPSLSPDVAGVYLVSLTVADGYDSSAVAAIAFTATDPSLLPDGAPCGTDSECMSGYCLDSACASNQAPVAEVSGPSAGQVGQLETFDGSASSDPESAALLYTWTLLAAPPTSVATLAGAGGSVTLTPDAAGAYVVGLTVSDGYLNSPMSLQVFTAAPAPGSLPDGDPCSDNIECSSGFCAPGGTCQCIPTSCVSLGATCGEVPNGCGDLIACGTCAAGQVCNASLTCECVPQDCAAQAYECGVQSDGCGDTVDCGSCVQPPSGLGANTCVVGLCQFTCDGGAEVCSGDCIDPLTDPEHCGGCGVADCGAAACVGGLCEKTYTLSVVSGDGQTVGLGEPTAPGSPLVVKVTDGLGDDAVGVTVSVISSAGAHATPASAATAADGTVSFQLWTGIKDGAYTFTLGVGPDASPIDATLNAAVVPGRLYPVTNFGYASSTGDFGNLPGPSTQVEHGLLEAGAMAMASDGTLYVSSRSQHAIFRISPSGASELFAGTPPLAGYDGDGGPATDARLSEPRGVALDEANQRLYVVDGQNRRIRYVDLADGNIYAFAGGGPSGGSNGDGGSPLSAYLSQPFRVHVAPNGDVYVSDSNRIRVISGGQIDHFIGVSYDASGGSCFNATSPTVQGCGGSYGYTCDMLWAPDGSVFLSADLCGKPGSASQIFAGILRIEADGTRRLVAGSESGGTTDGLVATTYDFGGWVTAMAMDPAGNLFVGTHAFNSSSYDGIRRIDGATGVVTTIAGGIQGQGGLYGPALDAQFDAIVGVRFDPSGNLLVVEHDNRAVRGIGAVAQSAGAGASLVAAGGDAETHRIADLMVPQPSAQLLDGAGQPVLGAPITFTTDHPGVYPQLAVVPSTFPGTASSFFGRMGLGFEPVTVFAEYRDLLGNHVSGSPVSYTLGVEPPADGDIFTAVNVGKVSGAFEAGPATNAKLNAPVSSCAGPDGSIYVADTAHDQVLRITPEGEAVVVAGTGTGGYGGDGGPATSAMLQNPTDVGLDSANGVLYIADSGNEAVRAVDLNSGTIYLFAGRGSQTAPPHGDAGPRLDATFHSLTRLAVASDGSAVYTTETGGISTTRMRRIDVATGQVQPLLYHGSPGCNAAPVAMQSCEPDYCAIDVGPAPDYDLYYSGNLCGTEFGGWAGGVARYDVGTQAWTAVTGPTSASSGDGMPAASTFFTWAQTRDAAVGPDGTIYVAEAVSNVIRRIDGATSIVTTVAGVSGSSGSSGEFVPGTSALLNNPRAVAVHPDGHLVITSQSASAVRVVWRSCGADADCLTTGHCNTVIGACTAP